MKYQIVGKNIVVTEAISNAITKKLKRMDKYFVITDDVTCRAVVRSYKTGAKVEITIFTHMMDFRAEVEHEDLYAAVDLAVDKLQGQMRKLKTRLDRTNRPGLSESIALENFEADLEVTKHEEVVRTKEIYLEPMQLEEAITRMEALGHDFYMYLDADDHRIGILYHRVSGGYGVIQAENAIK